MNRRALFFSTCLLATACASDTKTGNASDSGASAPTELYSLTLSLDIETTDGTSTFMTPVGSSVSIDADSMSGKPWYMAFFIEGALAGVDMPLHDAWGEVGPNLEISHTTPSMFQSGNYDAVAIVYVGTEIQESDKSLDLPPMIGAGDLSSFTLAEDVIPEGDPNLDLGFVRLSAENNHGAMEIRNKIPADPDDNSLFRAAFIDTVLIIP